MRHLAAALTLAATAAGCGGHGEPPPATNEAADRAPSQTALADAARLGPSVRAFAVELHHQLAVADDNVLSSPTSVALALGMAQLGARGATAAELARALHLSSTTDHAAFTGLSAVLQGKGKGGGEGWELASANRLWAAGDLTLSPDYVARVGAGLERLDYTKPDAAARAINAWTSAQTRDRIRDLVGADSLRASTRLVLTNALYLKAAWRSPFDPALTVDAPFTTLAGARATIRMMAQTETFRLAAVDGAHAVELPYDGGALSLVVIMPDDPAAFRAYEQAFDDRRLGALLDGLTAQRVSVSLPRFEVRTKSSLREALEGLGVKVAFTDGADFGGISSEALKIDAVIHDGFFRIDERGTEAAAATAVMIMESGAPPAGAPYAFRADRPFLYVLRHNVSGAILFMGRLADPAPIGA